MREKVYGFIMGLMFIMGVLGLVMSLVWVVSSAIDRQRKSGEVRTMENLPRGAQDARYEGGGMASYTLKVEGRRIRLLTFNPLGGNSWTVVFSEEAKNDQNEVRDKR